MAAMRTILLLSLVVLASSCATTGPCVGVMPELSAMNPAITPYRVDSGEGECLQAYEWKAGSPRGAVVVMHGIRDHALRYDGLARALNAKGFSVYAQDMRGHGRSGGDRQRFDSMPQLVADLHHAVSEAKTRNPGLPVFLYGHSLGGLIGTTYTIEHPSELSGLVLSGPALKLFPTVTGGEKSGARFFSAVIPGLKVQSFDDTEFSRDEAAKKELASDPLIDHSNLPARSAAAALNGIDFVQEHLADVKVPFVVMHGTVDTATNLEGSVELSEKAGATDKTLKTWEGLHHDLLHEPERDQVAEFVTRWIDARLPR